MKKYGVLLIVALMLSSFKPKELTWVAIGDSITYLNDHKNETRFRVTKGYLTRVVEEMPNLTYINQGHNGWTSGGIAEQIDSLGIVKADVYSIFLGTNDWWQGRPVGNIDDYKNAVGNTTIYGSFRIIVNKIKKLNPAAKILLITPMQRMDFVYINDPNNNAYGSYKPKNNQWLEEVANAIRAIGQLEQIPVVDLYHNPKLKLENLVKFKRLKDPATGQYKNYQYPLSTTIPFSPKDDEYPYPLQAQKVTFDGLHPSDKGYKIITDGVVSAFKKLGL